MTRFVLLVSIVVGMGGLARGYFEGGETGLARALIALAILWLLAQLRNLRWFPSLGLLAVVGFAAYGIWTHQPAGWMLTGTVGALFAWDLSDFEQRMENAPTPAERAALEPSHLLRLSLVAALGFFVSLASMLLRFQFTFEWVAFLALLAAIGFTQLL